MKFFNWILKSENPSIKYVWTTNQKLDEKGLLEDFFFVGVTMETSECNEYFQ